MPDEIKPWTIKNISPEHRSAFTVAARRAKLDIGAWIVRAGLAHIQAERAERRAPAVVVPTALPVDPAELANVVAMAVDLAGVSGGNVPKSVERLAWRVMRARLRGMESPRPASPAPPPAPGTAEPSPQEPPG